MKALDAYRDLLKELDKWGSPTFSVRDFNYFYPLSVSRYVDQNYKFFDIMQKENDDMRFFLTYDSPLTLASGKVALPSDYRHVLHVKAKMRFTVAIGKYSINQEVEFFPERMKSGQKGFRFKNAFSKPNYKRCYYEIVDNDIRLIYDSTVMTPVTGTNLWLDYVKQTAEPYLNPNPASDFSQVANNTILIFNQGSVRNHIYYEIITKCREVFLENIESSRYPNAAQESQKQ
jgi:hypothetical protein